MGHKILEKMKYKNTNKLMIVAHADDEVIWAGEKLLKEKGQWDILCVVTPDHLSKFRIPIFENLVSDYFQANTTMLKYWEDPGFNIPVSTDIIYSIYKKIKSKEWTEILTHGEAGEYGHLHHKQVHSAVVHSVDKLGLLDKLWVFDPIKQPPIENLTEEKAHIFVNTYDDETNLPIDHPRKWVHGWNTTQGWVENIKKWEA